MNMYLKITDKNNKPVVCAKTARKRRILYLIQADKTKMAAYFLKVTYRPTSFHNDGCYSNKKDLVKALRAFTE